MTNEQHRNSLLSSYARAKASHHHKRAEIIYLKLRDVTHRMLKQEIRVERKTKGRAA